jgi:hypothetical protein
MKSIKLQMRARERFFIWREALATAWPLVLLVLAGFGAALYFVKPAPPKHLVMSTGREDGAYHAFAKRYQEIFACNRVINEANGINRAIYDISGKPPATIEWE